MVLGFNATEARSYAGIAVFGKAIGLPVVMTMAMIVVGVACAEQADVVGEVAVVHADTALVRAIVEAQGKVAGNGLFLGQIGIPDLKGAGRHMGAVGIQFVKGRGTFGIAKGCGQRPDGRQPIHRTRRQAACGEARIVAKSGKALIALGIRMEPGMFDPRTQVQHQAFAGLQLLEHEQRKAVGVGIGHEGFLAQGRELAAAELGADHAV
ncbi:hypothetical protein D9M71_247160 [compost metagenome]